MGSKSGDMGVSGRGRSRGAGAAKSSRALFVVEANGLRFGLAERDGAITRQGRFPADAPPGETIVVANYALLSRPEIFQLGVGRTVGLLPPSGALARPESTGEQPDFGALARSWSGIPPLHRARLSEEALPGIDPLLALRREALLHARRAADDARNHLLRAFPGYAEVLAPQGNLRPEAFEVLRAYPTPAHLRADDGVRLAGVLAGIFDRYRQHVGGELMNYRRGVADPEPAPAAQAHSTLLILGAVETWELHRARAGAVDRAIHQLASPGEEAVEPLRPTTPEATSILDLPSRGGIVAEPSSETLEALVAKLRALRARASSNDRDPKLDLGAYLQLRAAIERAEGDALAPTIALEAAALGQRLALAATDYPEAAHALAATQRILDEATPDELGECERFEAEFTMAITGLVTTNVPTGFGRLRELLQDPRSANADPALLGEMLGLVMLTLTLYGEMAEHRAFIATARERIDALPDGGAARAARDIAELLITGTRPEISDEERAALIALSDTNSQGTYLRSFHNFVMMTVCYVTRDRDAAANNYAELKRNGAWERHSPSLHAQAELSHAYHLAGSGDLGAARRQLASLRQPTEAEGAGTFETQRALFSLYLAAAIGDSETILQATEPEGPLGEQRLLSMHATRFQPVSLVLRGSALVREGAKELGETMFRQATLAAAQINAWVVLLCGETAEYRSWLDGLPDQELPEGLTPEARARIVARPLFFEHQLPSLTRQQARVLRLLALGNSTSAIAADLHITANTLKTHLRRLYARLGVSGRREAVHFAEGYGLDR